MKMGKEFSIKTIGVNIDKRSIAVGKEEII